MSDTPSIRPLVLILKTWRPDKGTLKMLEAAGYAPLVVKSFDGIKIIEPFPVGPMNAITRAAMATIAACPYSATRDEFGKRVATILSATEAKEAAK